MKKFRVVIEETATYEFEVEAESEAGAREAAMKEFVEVGTLADYFVAVADRSVRSVERI